MSCDQCCESLPLRVFRGSECPDCRSFGALCWLRVYQGFQGSAFRLGGLQSARFVDLRTLFSYQTYVFQSQIYELHKDMYVQTRIEQSTIKINSRDVDRSDSFSCSGQRRGESHVAWWPAFAEPRNREAH